jgi:PAS domain S-box-containing protein
VRPWYTAGDDVGGVIIFSEDITKRKNTEEALRVSEEKYRRILENLQDGYFRGNERGIVTMANRKAARMFGYDSPDELIGMPVVSMYHRAGDRDTIIHMLEGSGEVTDYAVEGVRKDGTTFWCSLSAQTIRDDVGRVRGTEGIVREISGRIVGHHTSG